MSRGSVVPSKKSGGRDENIGPVGHNMARDKGGGGDVGEGSALAAYLTGDPEDALQSGESGEESGEEDGMVSALCAANEGELITVCATSLSLSPSDA